MVAVMAQHMKMVIARCIIRIKIYRLIHVEKTGVKPKGFDTVLVLMDSCTQSVSFFLHMCEILPL